MKIMAFRVEHFGATKFEDVLSHVNALDLEQRIKMVGVNPMRLEVVKETKSHWFIDLTKIRADGPGRISPTKPVADFDLEDDEGFSEETAGFYDPKNMYIVLQYNHHGARANAIREYFDTFVTTATKDDDDGAPSGFAFIPVIKAGTAAQLKRMKIFKHIECSVFVPGALAFNKSDRPSLSAILDDPLVASAQNLTINLSAGRERGATLNLDYVKKFLHDVMVSKDDVQSLKITGQESEDDPREFLDLLKMRLEIDDETVQPQKRHRRLVRQDRWNAIKSAYDAWRADGSLPEEA